MSVVRRLVIAGVGSVGIAMTATAAEDPAAAGGYVYVKMVTNKGDIVLELDSAKAPVTVENFMKYVDKGFYNDTIVHRVVNVPTSIGVIQGGGFGADLKQKPTEPAIKNEWDNGLVNARGTIAMARTGDPNSATSQWFINTRDNLGLSRPHPRFGSAGYAVFGKVIGGMEAVDAIAQIPTTQKTLTDDQGRQAPSGDVPSETVTITKAERVKPEEVSAQIASARAAEAEVVKAKEAEKAAAAAKAKVVGEAAVASAAEFLKSKNVDVSKGVYTDDGAWYYEVTPGTGKSPEPASPIRVHYTGWLASGGEPFDTSLKGPNSQPLELPLNRFIPGWAQTIGSMKEGGKRFVVVPSELGYGARANGQIPPNSVLVFEVELVEVR